MVDVTTYLIVLETTKIQHITISTTFNNYKWNTKFELVKNTLFHQKSQEGVKRLTNIYRLDFDGESERDKFKLIFQYDPSTPDNMYHRCFIFGNFIFVTRIRDSVNWDSLNRHSVGIAGKKLAYWSRRIYLDKNITERNRIDRERKCDGTSHHMINSIMSVTKDLDIENRSNFTICVDEQPLRHTIEECLNCIV